MIYRFFFFSGVVRQCYRCRSRGESGDCKDPFVFNSTTTKGTGVETIPCASGWCSKIIEGGRDNGEFYVYFKDY